LQEKQFPVIIFAQRGLALSPNKDVFKILLACKYFKGTVVGNIRGAKHFAIITKESDLVLFFHPKYHSGMIPAIAILHCGACPALDI
jgi:hypothetical protein